MDENYSGVGKKKKRSDEPNVAWKEGKHKEGKENGMEESGKEDRKNGS